MWCDNVSHASPLVVIGHKKYIFILVSIGTSPVPRGVKTRKNHKKSIKNRYLYICIHHFLL